MNCVSKLRTSALPGNASGIARITGMPVAVAFAMTDSRYGMRRYRNASHLRQIASTSGPNAHGSRSPMPCTRMCEQNTVACSQRT